MALGDRNDNDDDGNDGDGDDLTCRSTCGLRLTEYYQPHYVYSSPL